MIKARLVARPSVWRYTVGKQPARKHSICQSYVRWAASPHLVAHVVAALRHSNQQRCRRRKKVQEVLTSAVRSVTKRLALHCIATAVLPLQRVFPHTIRLKQGRKLHSGLRQGQVMRLSARRPAQLPTTNWGQHTAAPSALKTGHFKQSFIDCNILPTRYDNKKLQWPLCQGQAMRLSVHRLAQRAATQWGRDTSTPDALKTAHFLQIWAHFHTLQTWNDPKELHWLLRQG